MTKEERRLPGALAWMCEQYLSGGTDTLDHLCMSAGEEAVELLAKYGLVEPLGRGGTWTPAGKALLYRVSIRDTKRRDNRISA